MNNSEYQSEDFAEILSVVSFLGVLFASTFYSVDPVRLPYYAPTHLDLYRLDALLVDRHIFDELVELLVARDIGDYCELEDLHGILRLESPDQRIGILGCPPNNFAAHSAQSIIDNPNILTHYGQVVFPLGLRRGDNRWLFINPTGSDETGMRLLVFRH